MESWWDEEILKFYAFDNKRKVFDYDINGAVELKEDAKDLFKTSFLCRALEILHSRTWSPKDEKILGEGNAKIYDYLKAVCLVSYFVSTEFIPLSMPVEQYNKLKILSDQSYFNGLKEISPYVFADAVDSIALVWLLTWDKYNKLQEDIAQKKKEIADQSREKKKVPA
jgi:hypothetical protein